MSFITKRERVFNEYNLYELPPRNEGKLKAYDSCTDARAWSHFGSDKSEHLVDIIKRNNEMCRPKYVPTNVIVDTLMGVKNNEITRLKRKIAEFEQMLAVYDQLDLSEDQKIEINSAHEAIRAANRDLDELYLDLDMTGFTEGIDSEAFETGKSAGDISLRSRRGERLSTDRMYPSRQVMSQSNQMGESCTNECGTCVVDPRIDEMKETIIVKDAKLNAMQNTIAVMENDVCEPYCLYAHIYTALEKIFGILSQNAEYKRYLDLLSMCCKDSGIVDIKGKILYKLKILEKFCIALLNPCAKKSRTDPECACYRAEMTTRVETTYALTSAEVDKPTVQDNKRAQLIADIMANDELKNVISSVSVKPEQDECFILDNYNIDTENLNRLKNLQKNYDELMICYENLKEEKNGLMQRCKNYDVLESEVENLQSMLKEYNTVWNEKEHFKKRSEDLHSLREQFMVLSEETLNIEGQLKAESEINSMKASKISELTDDNINLEKRISDITIAFEKEKNSLECKLKETECKIMCQEQQIKSMSIQIDRLLDQDKDRETPDQFFLLNEIGALKDEVNNLKDTIFCNEEEKDQLQEQFEEKLAYINNLKMEIEDWKSKYEKLFEKSEYLEQCFEESKDELNRLVNENKNLLFDIGEKTVAVENLMNVLTNKCEETDKLLEECEQRRSENHNLREQLRDIQNIYHINIENLEAEKEQAFETLQLVKKESDQLLERVKDYDNVICEKENMERCIQNKDQEFEDLKRKLKQTQEENKKLQLELKTSALIESNLLKQVDRLNEFKNEAQHKLKSIESERDEYQIKFHSSNSESLILKNKLSEQETLAENLQKYHNEVSMENQQLEQELKKKSEELHSTIEILNLSKSESDNLLRKSEEDISLFNENYKKTVFEKDTVQKDLSNKSLELELLKQSYDNLKLEIKNILQQFQNMEKENCVLQTDNANISFENSLLQSKLESCINENIELKAALDKNNDNLEALNKKIQVLSKNQQNAENDLNALEVEHLSAKDSICSINKENDDLKKKLENFYIIEDQLNKLKDENSIIKSENDALRNNCEMQSLDIYNLNTRYQDLIQENREQIALNESLKTALTNARNESESDENSSTARLLKTVEEMKKEKAAERDKIRELHEKIDDYDSKISNLKQDNYAKDDRIVILENHINKLEDELKQLQNDFAALLETSEELKDNSYQNISNTMRNVESYHSQTTEKLKHEISKLKDANALLEQELQTTNNINEEILLDNNNLINQLKELEIKSVGESKLSPENYNSENILRTFERIRYSIDTSIAKNSSLEQTLLNVQTSTQLLQSKTDEVKKIIEKEKEKFISEKEEAIQDKINMENQLQKLKDRLKEQIAQDKAIINDLQSELLNQKLLIQNMNECNHDTIIKLKNDMENLENSYKNAVAHNEELQLQIQSLSNDNNKHKSIIDSTNNQLKEKLQEIKLLKKELALKSNVNKADVEIQASNIVTKNNKSQTVEMYNNYIKPDSLGTDTFTVDDNSEPNASDFKMMANEIQVMTASTEPNTDFVRNSYLRDKMKSLSRGPLKQDSIIDTNVEDNSMSKANSATKLSNRILERPSLLRTNSSQNIMDNTTDDMNDSTMSNLFLGSEKNDRDILFLYKDKQSTFDSVKTDDGFNRVKQPNSSIYKDKQSTFDSVKADESFNRLKQTSGSIYKDKQSTLDSVKADESFNRLKQPSSSLYKDKHNTLDSVKTDESLNRLKQPSSSLYKDKQNTLDSVKTDESLNRLKQPSSSLYKDKQNTLDSVKTDESLNRLKQPSSSIYKDKQNTFDSVKNDESLNRLKQPSNSTPIKLKAKLENPIYFKSGSLEMVAVKTDAAYKDKSHIIQFVRSTDRPEIGSTVSDNEKGTIDSESFKTYSSPRRTSRSDENIYIDNNTFNITTQNTPSLPTISDENNYHIPVRVDGRESLSNKNRINYSQQDRESSKVLRFLRNKDLEGESDNKSSLNSLSQNDYNSNSPFSHKEPSEITYETKSGSENEIVEKPGAPNILEDQEVAFSQQYDLYPVSEIPSESSSEKRKATSDKAIDTNLDNNVKYYEDKIRSLSNSLDIVKKECSWKIEAVKSQYDNNIKIFLNEHNQGVQRIQSLHEETLQDIIKSHENEVDNLRSLSIEAMKKADKYDKENKALKTKLQIDKDVDQEPVKISAKGIKKKIDKAQVEIKNLTKTNVQAINVQSKPRNLGPCTCSVDVTLSDTIRNIFEQVDVNHRKAAENNYVKYIANKLIKDNIDMLDAQELSFLHLKVCRAWKLKLSKEEILQKKIHTLEAELMNKQRGTQQQFADLDRMVEEEKKRLQVTREAVFREAAKINPDGLPDLNYLRLSPETVATRDQVYGCKCADESVMERRSAGDLADILPMAATRPRKIKTDNHNRAILVKLEPDNRKDNKGYQDDLHDQPTKLRRTLVKSAGKKHKK